MKNPSLINYLKALEQIKCQRSNAASANVVVTNSHALLWMFSLALFVSKHSEYQGHRVLNT
jgi:hypothetical protein